MPATYKILIMGASYGLSLASEDPVWRPFGASGLPAGGSGPINGGGFPVRLPVKGRKDPIEIDSRKLPGKVTAGGAAGVNPTKRL